MTKKQYLLLCSFGVSLLAASVYPVEPLAETTDFGGYPDRFKGVGDREPPRCQIDVPRSATEAFDIKWNCIDDACDPDEIVTELWVRRNNGDVPRKISDFLGFPAAVHVDENVLQAATIADGLPANFRLVARDRAGNATLSPFVTVLDRDNDVQTCDLKVVTEATPSSGGTTGVPAMSVVVTGADVQTSQSSNTSVRVATVTPATTSICEIDEICDDEVDNDKVTFSAALTVGSNNTASGIVTVRPGAVSANVSGSNQTQGSSIGTLEVTGDTVIGDVAATVTLTCHNTTTTTTTTTTSQTTSGAEVTQ